MTGLPDDPAELSRMRERLAERYPLQELYAAKRKLDPKGVLGNTLIDTLLLPEHALPAERRRALERARGEW